MTPECTDHILSDRDIALATEIARHIGMHADCPLGMTEQHREMLDGAIRWKARAVTTIAVTIVAAGVGAGCSLLFLGVKAAVQIIANSRLTL